MAFEQMAQNVHSNVQISASVDSGGKSISQHSQLGLNASIWLSFYTSVVFIRNSLKVIVTVVGNGINDVDPTNKDRFCRFFNILCILAINTVFL